MIGTASNRRAIRPIVVVAVAVLGTLLGVGLSRDPAGGDATTQTTIPAPLPSGAAVPVTTIPIPTTPPNQMTHQNAPTIVEASVACLPSELTAVLAGTGPYSSNIQTGQYIISITSSTPCTLAGYPSGLTIASASSSSEVSAVNDGGVVGDVPESSTVTATPNEPISFLFQFNNALTCTNDSAISFELPNSTVPINVEINSLVSVCGAIGLTPFAQGNSVERYF
jgi:hypothetical protein